MIVKDQIKKRELDPEQKKEIRDLRNHAVRDAWKQEKELLLQGRGHRQWNQRQQREILERGSVRGYQGHHMISVQNSAEQAGNPDNIQFLTWKEHLQAHGGNYFQPTNGYYDPETGKMHVFSNGIPHQPAPVALAIISPVLMAAIHSAHAGTNGKNSTENGNGSVKNVTDNAANNRIYTGGSSGSQGGTGMINVDEQKYEDMISALQIFAQTIDEKVGEMMTLTNNCLTIMDGDEAITKAVSRMGEVEKAYLEAAKEALAIAKDVQADLDDYRSIKSMSDADE